MTMATPSWTMSTTLDVSCFSCVRALHCMGLRLHSFLYWVWCCLSRQLTSDLSSSASWAGSLEEACYTTVMQASMGVLGCYGKNWGLYVRGIADLGWGGFWKGWWPTSWYCHQFYMYPWNWKGVPRCCGGCYGSWVCTWRRCSGHGCGRNWCTAASFR